MIRLLFLFLIFLGLNLGYQPSAVALDVYFEQLPDNYRIFMWDNESNDLKSQDTYRSEQFRRIRFTIPDQFVQRDSSGNVNLSRTLESWRIGTDRGFMLPRTNNSIGRFPFTIDNGDLDRRAPSRNVYYIAAQDLLQNIETNNLRFGTLDEDERVYAENLGLVERVNTISQSNISCTGGRSAVAGWSPEKCLMCNCANEAYARDTTGQTMIAQVVFRRVASRTFPQPANRSNGTRNNICGIISEPAQFSWVGRPNQRTITSNSEYMNNCRRSTIEAIRLGPGRYDHFHTTGVRPAWASSYIYKLPNAIGNHYFYQRIATNNAEIANLNAEFNSSAGQQIFRPLEPQSTSRGQSTEFEDQGVQ